MATGKVNGKSKGNSFERRIATLLSARFESYTGLKTGFRRNADSGAFFGGSNMYRAKQYDLDNACFGDLMCPKDFKFSIECKHYKIAPTFKAIFAKDVKQWDMWLAQAEQDASNAKKSTLLIIKYNNVPEFIFVKEKLAIPEIIQYKGYYSYLLSDALSLGNAVFFDSTV